MRKATGESGIRNRESRLRKTEKEWGKIRSRAERTMPVVDTLIASAAITHHLTLVTRNIKDFNGIEGIMLLNPWESA